MLLTFLAKALLNRKLHYSYRFLFLPETIGAITWLCRNQEGASRIRHGLVATCVGDPGGFTYKQSRSGCAEIDQVLEQVFSDAGKPLRVRPFAPIGSDERQYCSPGFDLPVGSLMRTPYYEFEEYHTSADDLRFVTSAALDESLEMYLAVVEVLEMNSVRYVRSNPFCEPHLGKRGLYRREGGARVRRMEEAFLWVLNYSDGNNSLLDISSRSQIKLAIIAEAARTLSDHGLLEPAAQK